LGWQSKSKSFNESEMALFHECMLKCAQKLLDTADIVREAIFHQSCRKAISRTRSFGGLGTLKFVILNLVGQAVLAETFPLGRHAESSSNDDIDWLELAVLRERANDGQYMLVHFVVRRSPQVHVGLAALWRHQD